jgi:hypothetical protein
MNNTIFRYYFGFYYKKISLSENKATVFLITEIKAIRNKTLIVLIQFKLNNN